MRAVAYIRVSDLSQVEGHSLDAQERLFNELCRNRGWDPVGVYREEGKSAHVDSIKRRPVFRQLLDDSGKGLFDVVVVHTLDRWSRNLRVMLEALGTLGSNGIGLVSITENIDYSTPHGKMATQMLGSVAEFFSEALSTHVKKGRRRGSVRGPGRASTWGPSRLASSLAGRSPRESASFCAIPSIRAAFTSTAKKARPSRDCSPATPPAWSPWLPWRHG